MRLATLTTTPLRPGFFQPQASAPGAGVPVLPLENRTNTLQFQGKLRSEFLLQCLLASPPDAEAPPADKPFAGKKILVGITGGIAAYKACDVIRMFQKQGAAKVVAMMTPDAQSFIPKLTLESLTMNPVLIANLENTLDGVPTHIAMPQQMDVMVIVPTTANTLSKLAHGASDNVLTSTALTFTNKPLVICPAMNTRMWENPLTQENLARLKALSYVTIVPPDSGLLACGETGDGKLAPPEHVGLYTQRALSPNKSKYQGKHFVIVGGGLSTPLQPGLKVVSEGPAPDKLLALADALFAQGAKVTLLSGDPIPNIRPYAIKRTPTVDALQDALNGQTVDKILYTGADNLPQVIDKPLKLSAQWWIRLPKTAETVPESTLAAFKKQYAGQWLPLPEKTLGQKQWTTLLDAALEHAPPHS